MDIYDMTDEDYAKARLLQMISVSGEPDEDAMRAAMKRWTGIAKPIGSLGAYETAVVKMAGVQGNPMPDMDPCAIVVLCGDHGVVKEGVTQTDSSVTRTVAENIAGGDGCINIFARRAGADVFVVDAGMDCDPYPVHELTAAGTGEGPAIADRKIGRGTGNIAAEPAMSEMDCVKALSSGVGLAKELCAMDYRTIGIGEMGIGNTTPASAIVSVLLDLPAGKTTGHGAGLSDEAFARKKEVVDKAVARYWEESEKHELKEDEFFRLNAGVEILSQLGGYEIAMMAGLCIGAQIFDMTVVIDGFISSVAALCANLINPGADCWMLASHLGSEPAAAAVLQELQLYPVIRAGMHLGEGTGAAQAIALYRMGLDLYKEMKSFDEMKITPYEVYENKGEQG